MIDRTTELEAESKLRHEAEETLRQAQKMEAVGQLTGGIAHDFNNLLTIIIGNLDTMRRQLADLANRTSPATLSPSSRAARMPLCKGAQARPAHAEAARLLPPPGARAERLDMNRLVSGMLDMLRRTLGAEISIETVLGAGLWPAFADPHQLENVLLNLALNAKDAMPQWRLPDHRDGQHLSR